MAPPDDDKVVRRKTIAGPDLHPCQACSHRAREQPATTNRASERSGVADAVTCFAQIVTIACLCAHVYAVKRQASGIDCAAFARGIRYTRRLTYRPGEIPE